VRENDKKQFSELMLAIGEVFQKIPNKTQMEIYFRALEDLTIEQVSHACSEIVKTRKITGTLPLPAEIRDLAGGGNLDDRALVAWHKLVYALDHYGCGNSVAFDDPAIMGAIILWAGSWRKIKDIEWTYDNDTWVQKAFISAYKAAAREQMRTPEYFPGDYEHDNGGKGLISFIPKPFLIGGKAGEFFAIQGPAPMQLPDGWQTKELSESIP